ncbi:MAG: glycosyltransferase family 2 protein [Acidimicrobiia bacterium]|nr:glycosyltransferase family 2 protein [Acidimicrobiia bacterium]
MGRLPSVDIIIVNWNTGPLLGDCLRSIAQSHQDRFCLNRVVVVDNGSVDGSADGVGHLLAPPAIVLRNGTNHGFAAACNHGAASALAQYLLFLNPDARLFPDSLPRAVHFLEQEENTAIGICGVRQVDDSGAFSTSCARFPTLRTFFGQMTGLTRLFPNHFPPHLMGESECTKSCEVDQVIGAFFLVRRTLFESLGGFDPRFFVYFEEVDFSLRARRLGFRSYYFADVAVCHLGGGSSRQVKAARLFYSLRSRLLYGFKHYTLPSAVTLALLTLSVEMAARVASAAASMSIAKLSETLQGYAALYACLCTNKLRWRS